MNSWLTHRSRQEFVLCIEIATDAPNTYSILCLNPTASNMSYENDSQISPAHSAEAGGDVATRPSPSHQTRALRWWPAALLLLLVAFLKYLPRMMETPGLPILMLGFMGPSVVCFAILGWWVFASRASIGEKLIGSLAVIFIAVLSIGLLHPSMGGLGPMIFAIPSGVSLFAIALIILANQPSVRLVVAIVAAAVGFGYWDLLQSEGVNGQFESALLWRWEPNAEQKYLKSREMAQANDADSSASAAKDVKINLATAKWSSFRGPSRDGKQYGVAINSDWQTTPPKEVWKTRIGPGWSSFAVAADRLFTQEQRRDKEAVVCMDAKTGKTIWSFEYPSRFSEPIAGAGPRATPTIADEGLFALGADGILVCLDPVAGTEKWRKDIKVDADRTPPMWGFSASPLVTSGLVIVHAGGKDDKGVLAYDAKTGDLRWAVPSGDHSYSSPQLATFDSKSGVLMSSNSGLQFLNVADGETLWKHDWIVENYRAIQPLVLGNSVLLGTSLGAGTRRITVRLDGEQWKIDEDWTSRDMKPDFNDFVEHQGYLYGFDGNIFACVDVKTGKRMWKKGRYGSGQVLMLCDANQLLVTSEAGEIVLLDANPKEITEVARVQAIQGKTWNHPVLVGNMLFMRNAEEAACFELPQK